MKLLIIEDDETDARLLLEVLADARGGPFECVVVTSLAAAAHALAEAAPDVIVADLALPDSLGLDTVSRLREMAPDLPLVVTTASDTDALAIAAVNEGAQDYLTKRHLEPEVVSRALRYAVERHRLVSELQRLATVDDLTGLRNRRGFIAVADQVLEVAARTGQPVTLMFIDVDNLKAINDANGHAAGDTALRRTAEAVLAACRTADVTGRLGGDEFCVLALDSPSHTLAERIRASIAEGAPAIHVSIGSVDMESVDGRSIDELIERADAEMYRQKHAKRGRWRGVS